MYAFFLLDWQRHFLPQSSSPVCQAPLIGCAQTSSCYHGSSSTAGICMRACPIPRIRRIWFSPELPDESLDEHIQYMPRYEALGWTMSMLTKFVDFPRVVGGIRGWDERPGQQACQRIMILSGTEDPLIDPPMMHKLTTRYRQSVAEPGDIEKIDEKLYEEDRGQGVRLVLVKGASHHFQNDVQSIAAVGAQRLLDFVQQL